MPELTPEQLQIIREASKDEAAYQRILAVVKDAKHDEQVQMEHLLDRMPAIVYVKDMDNRFVFFNRYAEQAFKTGNAEVRGKTPAEVFLAETAQHFEAVNRSLAETSWLKPVEVDVTLADGPHIFLAHHVLLYDQHSNPYGVCGILTDITRWRWLTRVHQTIVEQTFQGLEIFQDGRVVFANQVFAEMLGYTVDELLAMTPAETRQITYEEDREQVWSNYAERLNGTRNSEIYEVRLVRKDHTVFWAEVRVSRIEYEGRPAVLAAVIDITDRKNAERSALDLALERERVRLISSFVQDSSHEFRTPLSTINTHIYMLRKLNCLDERSIRSLDRIGESVNSVMTLVEGLLTLSRLEAGQPMRLDKIMLVTLFDEVITHMSSEANRHRVELQADLQGAEMVVVVADHVRLVNALINLMRNAIQHSHPGGIVRLKGGFQQDHAIIQVMDEGVGMDEAVQARIFERFYRQDSAHSTQGLGLGLPIARKIVEAHNGQIHVRSQPGQGTTFTVSIPASVGEKIYTG